MEGGVLLYALHSGTFHVLDELRASIRDMIEAYNTAVRLFFDWRFPHD